MQKLSITNFFPAWVLALALAAGLLYAAPPFLLKRSAEQEGRFFVLPNLNHLSDDALYYLPRAREIYDGHFPSEVNFSEYKDVAWFILPPLPQAVTAGFIALTGGDVSAAVIGLIFVFGIANFLCFYAVGRVMLRSRLWAAALAGAALMTHVALRIPTAFYNKGVALDLIANAIPVLRRPVGELSLVRIDDPLLTMPLYLVSFLLLYRFAVRPDTKRALALGAALGLLTYVYFYYWVTILAIAGMLFVYEFWRAYRRGSYGSLKPWGVFAAAFGLLFIPQIVNFFLFRSLPGAADYVIRKGLEVGRGLRLSVYPDYVFYAVLGIVSFFLLRRERPGAPESAVPFKFVAASLAAMFFLWNAQIIAGFNMEPFHWWKTFAPLLFILSAVAVKEACERFIRGGWKLYLLQTALILLLVSMGAKKIRNAAAFLHPAPDVTRSYSVPRSIAESWEWINASLPPDATIISHSLVSSGQLATLTHANPYMAHPVNSLAPTAILEQRFAEAHKIMGASSDELLGRLSGPPFAAPDNVCPEPCAHDRDRFRDRFEFTFEYRPHELLYAALFSPRLTFDAIPKVSARKLPPEALERLQDRYERYEPRWDRFPEHTYIYIGPWERLLSRGGFRESKGITPVFANQDVRIYRVR